MDSDRSELSALATSLDDLTSALRMDEEFSVDLIDRLAYWLLDEGAAVVAISAGKHGLYLRTADRGRLARAGHWLAAVADEWAGARLHVPPVPAGSALTTNGAGDAMSAGLAFAVAAGAGPEDAALLASACSAAIMSGRGPSPATLLTLAPTLSPLFDLEVA